MKKTLKALTVGLGLLAVSAQGYAAGLPECDTAECQEYFKAYTILTKRGHSDAMATLGELYYAGYGTEKDLGQAFKWFRRAAKFGNTTAQYKAGIMYLQDTEDQDIDKGITLLKRSSKIGFSPSAFVLGKIYLGNELVKQDLAEADHWLAMAYELNNQEAQKFARQLKASTKGQAINMPTLYALIDRQASNKPGSTAPVGEMETITVTAPDFSQFFNDEIARLNNTRPDTEKGTGSNIAGRTCAEMWACSSEGDGERVRDFLLSDWGKVALSFR